MTAAALADLFDKFQISFGYVLIAFGGKSGEPHDFTVKLCLCMLFWYMVFKSTSLRAYKTMKPITLALMIAALFGIIRNGIELVLEWGYYHKVFSDIIYYYLSPPLEHFFSMLSTLFVCFYILNYVDLWQKKFDKLKWAVLAAHFAISVYVSIVWRTHFVAELGDRQLPSFCNLLLDSSFHTLSAILYLGTLLAVLCRILPLNRVPNGKKVTSYLVLFLAMSLGEQSIQVMRFKNDTHVSELLIAVMNNLHIWSILMLFAHVICTYILLLNNYWRHEPPNWREGIPR